MSVLLRVEEFGRVIPNSHTLVGLICEENQHAPSLVPKHVSLTKALGYKALMKLRTTTQAQELSQDADHDECSLFGTRRRNSMRPLSFSLMKIYLKPYFEDNLLSLPSVMLFLPRGEMTPGCCLFTAARCARIGLFDFARKGIGGMDERKLRSRNCLPCGNFAWTGMKSRYSVIQRIEINFKGILKDNLHLKYDIFIHSLFRKVFRIVKHVD